MLLALTLLAAVDTPLVQRVAVTDYVTVKVGDQHKAGDAIVAAAESAGGYFTMRDENRVEVRVPTAKASEVLKIGEAQGLVVSRSHEAHDYTEELERKRRLLQSRREVLERYFAVLQSARSSAVTTVEAQMNNVIAEIEELEGALRLAEHNLAYAHIVVNFQFRDRSAPVSDGASSFPWLNTMNLTDLLGDFQHVRN